MRYTHYNDMFFITKKAHNKTQNFIVILPKKSIFAN